MDDKLAISKYLSQVLRDWQDSRELFPKNVCPTDHWPIPFFGNPTKAVIATVGVNPSSDEFAPDRRWGGVKRPADWKRRLRDYFTNDVPAHEWFEPWRIGLGLLGVSYKQRTAAHFDVSYPPATAMLTNPRTDREEFRRMVERDAAWFFKLLLLCPNLKLLLTFGPVVGKDRQPESLFGFLFSAAPGHGFRVFQDETGWQVWHEPSRRVLPVHDADTPGEKCVTCRVVKNLHAHRHELRQWVGL